MKKFIKGLIIVIGVISINGCYTDNIDDRYSYYKFNREDEALLIKYNYVVGQIITYENQFGEQLHFKVILNESKKRGYYTRGTFSGGGGYLSNYYDSKIIRIEILENSGYEDISSGDYSKVNYIFSKNFDEFKNGVNFPMWNITFFSFINELQDNVNIYTTDYNSSPKNQMNVNGHLFQNIVLIESNSNETNNSSAFGPLLQNVNKIYYDYDFGIVQFDDMDGKQWKLIYPE